MVVSAVAISEASPCPQKSTFERIGDLNLACVFDNHVANSGTSRKLSRLCSQHPKSKAVSIPMGDVDLQVGLCCLGRAHTAEVTGNIRIEMQRDQILQMAFVQSLGD